MMQFNLRGESRMQQLSGQDASFVYMETPTTPMHIGSVGIYDPSTAPNGFVRFKDILQFIESRLGGAKSFRERLVRVPFDIDHPYWIQDPDFDLEYHVRHIALPAPGDWRQLCIQVARLHSRPMDLTKPLWEFIIVEGLDNIEGLPKGCFALVAKVHHAAIDGMSGVEMSAAVHDLSPDKSNRFPEEDWKPDSKPGIGDLLISGYFNALRQPQKYLETMARSVPGIARLASELTKGDLSIAGARVPPKTRFNAKVSSHRVFDGVPFPLNDVRAIKDAVPGATVVVTAGSAAEALVILDEQGFDLALVDMIMPEMDGMQLTQQIRQRYPASTARMPILALTANHNPVDRQRCLDAGMDGVLDKPIDLKTLVLMVTRHISRSRGAQHE
jgi:WS/DGAT/MGAT family acyltransferase